MKKCSVFLFLLVTLAAVGQKEYRIEGKVRNAAGNTVVQLLVWAGNCLLYTSPSPRDS